METIIKAAKYEGKTIQKIEEKWRTFWYTKNVFRATDPKLGERTFYCLDMFPYPSGAGLHVGHPVGYVASDIISRFKRMQGFNVLHPMGWDAFGLPTERYAIKTGIHPAITTRENAAVYKRQMNLIGLSYDWEREFSTTDPEYYRWTQFIFLRMYNAWFDEEQQRARPISELPIPSEVQAQGDAAVRTYVDDHRLVYYNDAVVNWCPQLNTVVANEEVMNDGRTEHGYEVIRKPMRQVTMRITAYADRLIEGLEGLDWPDSIKEQQRTWIGRTEGVEVLFEGTGDVDIRVFTTRVDTIYGVTFLVIAPELDIVDQITTPEQRESVTQYVQDAIRAGELTRKQQKAKTGVFTGYSVKNPLTGALVPVFVADYVLKDHGTGAVMGVPAHDTRDFDFAKEKGLDILPLFAPESGAEREKVLCKEMAWVEDGVALDLDFPVFRQLELAGRNTTEVMARTTDYLVERGVGKRVRHYKMRDWVFARQRYWGDPIPLVNMDDGSVFDIPESELPLELPVLEDYSPAGEGHSALARAEAWYSYTAPDGRHGTRELSTMPQWAGSCWYALRYMDPRNSQQIVAPEIEKAWGAVDLYIGGAEHATLHLLYSRFWYLVLHDLGVIQTNEPYQKLVNQGMLTSFAYKTSRGIIVPIDDIEECDGQYFVKPGSEFYSEETADEPLEKVAAKMSKSLRNVVNPDDVIAEYGADSFRMYLMFMGPVEGGREWETRNILSTLKFLSRIWTLVTGGKEEGIADVCAAADEPVEAIEAMNTAVDGVARDIELMKYNTAISKIMICYNTLCRGAVSRETLEQLVLILAPFAPYMAEELWQRLGHEETLTRAAWPTVRPVEKTGEVMVSIGITLNGKRFASLEVPEGITDTQIQEQLIATYGDSKWKLSATDAYRIIRDKAGIVKLVNIVRKS